MTTEIEPAKPPDVADADAAASATARRRTHMDHDHPFYKWIVLSNTTLGTLLATINASIVLISLPAIFRGIDAFRTFDLVYGLTGGGPGQSTTTLSFEAFQNGFSFFRYGYASAVAYFMVVVAAIGLTVLLRFVHLRREEPA